MSTNTLKTRIKHAYKTEAEWSSSNPVLLEGEVGYVENGRFKVGDGISTWSELSYVLPSKSDIGLGNVGNFKAVSTVESQGLSDTEKSNARANIGAATIYRKRMVTLPTTGWIGDNAPYTIDIQIDGVLENSDVQITPILEMTLEQLEAWENLRLYAGKTYDGYITLKANGFKPNVEIPLEVLIGSVVIEETTEQITE